MTRLSNIAIDAQLEASRRTRALQTSEHPAKEVFVWSQFCAAVFGLCAGVIAEAAGLSELSQWSLGGATLAVLLPASVISARGLWRRAGNVDLVAVLAMAGALALRQELAGAVIAVMMTGGVVLEAFATGRARRELRVLLERAPNVAHRRVREELVDLAVGDVAVGDHLVVKTGEVVPADGVLISSHGELDESALTGESHPRGVAQGAPLRSGVSNVGTALELRVTASPAESTFAGVIRLVQAAEQSKAPFLRLVDRFALPFVALTLGLCAIAWLLSGDPTRALAVLVVATPCPLIIAGPVAMISGVSRAARRGILIKGGAPLEALSGVAVVLLDKTGTVTTSQPQLLRIETFGARSPDALLRVAASLEQVSIHPFAVAIAAEARSRGVVLPLPVEVHEETGVGAAGVVDGERVLVGQLSWVAPDAPRKGPLRSLLARTTVEGSSAVYVGIGGRLEGALILHNPVRAEAPRVIAALRREGIRLVHLVTGDHPDIAEIVGDVVGVDRVYSERTPSEKVEVVRQAAAHGRVAMVGDGVNDAPALALADVGIAMGARGTSTASETADIVLMTDRLEGLLTARRIATRTRRITRESVFVGMALSLTAMVVAGLGAISPVQGAVLQEAIDVLVILNALRALGGERRRRSAASLNRLATDLHATHRRLRPHVEEMAAVATRLDLLTASEARAALGALRTCLEQQILPHELDEQATVYRRIRELLPGEDPTGPLIQTHHEIQRLARLFGRLLDRMPSDGPDPDDVREFRRSLYGLSAVLALHFAQEDEIYSVLDA